MHRIDGEGATSDNKFTEGNPTTGAVATTVTADWCNAIQEEIAAVIAAAGITLNKAQNTQLRDAIQALISGGGVAVTAAGVTIADPGDYFSGGEVEAALQQLAQKVYAGTFAGSQIRRSVIGFNGGLANTLPSHAENIVHLNHPNQIFYTISPDSEVNLPIGTMITVLQAGAGVINFVPGAGVTLVKPDAFNARSLGLNSTAVLYKTDPNFWRLAGMLEAAT